MKNNNYKFVMVFFALGVMLISSCIGASKAKEPEPGKWPEITHVQKPWTRWWWMGSAVDKENITANLEAFAAAGIGGVEITPIYGVKGYEDKFIDYLSPQWMEMLNHTITEAARLGMQVDMVLGTGWPFGGPQVDPEFAASQLDIQKYEVKAGQKLLEPIIIRDKKQDGLATISTVLAYNPKGEMIDLTDKMVANGTLNWTAEGSDYEVFAVFCGKTRQQVKRAAPGGKGYTLDHFSSKAFADYVIPFDSALQGAKLRAIFNDSYEVYGATFTTDFFQQFEKRRGYDFRPFLKAFNEKTDSVLYSRLLSDYRETLSDLLLEEFSDSWKMWSNKNGYVTKFQAHGSPGNLIDLYASADIPECETFGSTLFEIPGLRRDSSDIRHVDPDPVMLKFSSSAAHLAGRQLTSSESFTWLADHFKGSLSQCKPELEQLFLSGVNHIFFHGSTYSPREAAWPGWKFYAAMNFMPNNTIWKDAPAFFEYIARCQSILQSGNPDNELLVYWPYYDALATASSKSLIHQFGVHSIDKWLHPTNFYKVLTDLREAGYSYDMVSDKFILQAKVVKGEIVMPGGTYKSLVVPSCERMPETTLAKLSELKKQGAKIVFEGMPTAVPGNFNVSEREETLRMQTQQLKAEVKGIALNDELTQLGIEGEGIAKKGLGFIKRKTAAGIYYYLVNHTSQTINEYIAMNAAGKSVVLYDAYTGKTGLARSKTEGKGTSVLVQLDPGESVFVGVFAKPVKMQEWKYVGNASEPIVLNGKWKVEFIDGGPEFPASVEIESISTWQTWSKEAEAFSGTARYTLRFTLPDEKADEWILDLGNVRESASVKINGKDAGTAWSVPFKIRVGEFLQKGENRIEIEVTNLGANRIRAKELRGEEWKIFHEINMVNVGYQKFDATQWLPTPSGLTETVKLIPVSILN